MAIHNNFSHKSRKIKDGAYDNAESPDSYTPLKVELRNEEEWKKQIYFYRQYMDIFAEEVLQVKLFDFQKVLLRAIGRYPNIMAIMPRSMGKSFMIALAVLCLGILYSNCPIGIMSGTQGQAAMIVKQYIEGQFSKNENIRRELVFPLKTGKDECLVKLKSGSTIRTVALGAHGDFARGWRFKIAVIDESRLVKTKLIDEIITPMTQYHRDLYYKFKEQGFMDEDSKIIEISSAYLKTCDLFGRYAHYLEEMKKPTNKDYFVCQFHYNTGIRSGIITPDFIERERTKPSMTKSIFQYEWEAKWVGSVEGSFYPYELTEPCRTLESFEKQQPKKSNTQYIISHDIALSDKKEGDNACSIVLKLKPKPNGTYSKKLVYIKTYRGLTLHEQRDELRKLVELFPNAIKLVFDGRSMGEILPELFDETWEFVNDKGEREERNPLVPDDDEQRKNLKGAIPLLRVFKAVGSLNNTLYTYMKNCFENKSLELLFPSTQMYNQFASDQINENEYSLYLETDLLIQELGNMEQYISDSGNVLYRRINKSSRKDRVSALGMALLICKEMEEENKMNANTEEDEFYCFYN